MRLFLVFLPVLDGFGTRSRKPNRCIREEWRRRRLALAESCFASGPGGKALRELDPQDTELDTVRYYSLLGLSVQRQDRPEDTYSVCTGP